MKKEVNPVYRTRTQMIELGYPATIIDRIRHSQYANRVILRTGEARNSKIFYHQAEFERVWREHYSGL